MYGITISACGLAIAGLLYYGTGADLDSAPVRPPATTTATTRTRMARRPAAAPVLSAARLPVGRTAIPSEARTVLAFATPQPAAELLAARPVSVERVAVEPATMPTASEGPLAGTEVASVEDDIRFAPTTRPTTPVAQHPPESDEKNVDTGKPVHEWQRLTDDWFGARPWLDDHGISFQSSLTLDYSTALTGGYDEGRDSAFRDLLNSNVTVSTERLLGLKGGTLFANVQQQDGPNGGEIAGNLQGVSNIDADGRFQISEVWYEQIAFDGRVRAKVGKIDANTDFAHTPTADEFVNGAMGAAPTILGFPTYPDPSTGALVFFKPTERFSVGTGVFDGSTIDGHPTGELGPAGLFDGGGLFSILEASYTWECRQGLEGTLGAGVWYHSGDFERLSDGTAKSGATGQYLMLDQKVWRENPSEKDDEQGIGFFAKYSHADASVSPVDNHVAAGVAWTGPIRGRDDDVLGLGITWACLSGDYPHHGNETVYELFYRLRLNAWFSVKPDLQYVTNPAAGGTSDTLVGSVRIVIDF